MKQKIDFNKFLEVSKDLEIKIGEITSVERVPKSDKMLELEVHFGGDDIRTVLTNIGNRIDDIDALVMTQLPFITNLEPAKIMGIESQAMIMVAENEEGKIEFERFTNGAKLM